ncbi:G1/S-specific cyclin-D2 [Drosophila bipectinata]|uniref:G1/S-specific cyclin-D2 n=1 Tax=Drosophila bipectinata TaxID=42026 RepID=UPI0038B3EB0C
MTSSYVEGKSTTALGNVNTAVRDPILISDRCLEIALRVERNRNQVDLYFSTMQKDITPAMRKIVAEWMLEVCAEEKCQEEVVLLALSFLDRFLSTKSVRKAHLQILAAACLLLASKLREPSCRALSVDLLVIYTDNSIFKDDLIKWELCVISRLGWDLSSVTPLDFVEQLIIRLPLIKKNIRDVSMEKIRRHAQAFISLAAKGFRGSLLLLQYLAGRWSILYPLSSLAFGVLRLIRVYGVCSTYIYNILI